MQKILRGELIVQIFSLVISTLNGETDEPSKIGTVGLLVSKISMCDVIKME